MILTRKTLANVLFAGAALVAITPSAPSATAGAGTPGAIPAGGNYSRVSWARTFLKADGLPQTTCNVNAVTEWEVREGGGFGNQASNNPLNVNPGPGAGWPGYNATGAWAFPTAQDGLRYTVMTLNNGNYGAILTALRAGNNAQAVMNAIQDSPWAASHYGYSLAASC